MEPSIMKLLEDNDEDETIHSVADVDAFAAALDRDIKGETSTSQPFDPDSGVLSRGSNSTSSQLFAQWQYSIREENMTSQNQQEGQKNLKPQEQDSFEVDLVKHGSGADSQQQQINCSLKHSQLPLQRNQSHDDHQLQRQAEQNAPQFSQKSVVQISEQNTAQIPEQDRMRHPDNQHQHLKLQKMNNRHAPPAGQTNNPLSQNKKVPFAMILELIEPHLDKDTTRQAQNLYFKLRSNEIRGDGFLRLMRNLVGDHLIRLAANTIYVQELVKEEAARNSESGAHQIQVPSTTTPVGTNVNTPPKKPSISQKKPVDALGAPSPMASKKQKVSGVFLGGSIEQLNDVTADSGVNIREEEEQLLSGPKEESRTSEATRKVVQEEEHMLILQKTPLHKKLAKIMSKCGIKNISCDVERCLSLCVEGRMRGLITNLIRLSKQRVDIERQRHQAIITSDVRRQILFLNRKAKEDWEKKQAEEVEELQKHNEVSVMKAEENGGENGEKDKDEGHSKVLKVIHHVQVNIEEVSKMRTTDANFAARLAVGGDDMLSKWQHMAEQARQKREGGTDVASAAQSGTDVRKSLSTFRQTLRDNQGAEYRGPSTAASGVPKKFERDSVTPLTKIARSISIKDLIAVLEREPQMSKSILIHRLYNGVDADSAAEGFWR